ncbi:MAG: DUF4388 domain-containing protein [Anaerolineae bacterium]|nr:DUF4388 domain-containing protein [Anaerolineae bacterium]
MALKGRLQDFGITQLLNLINLARKTGTLYVEGQKGEAQLCFREGKLIYAFMDGVEDSLPLLLQRAGKLTSEQAQTIMAHVRGKSDRDVALMLIQAKHIQQQDVSDSVRQHMLNLVYRVFGWNEGSFHFEPSELPVQGKLTTPVALENVIMEGSRRLKEWERLQDELPDLDIALKFADRPTTPLRDINLSVEEWRVISFINPSNTIRQVAQYNNMTEFQIRKIVYSLLQAGLVQIVRPPRPAATPPGSAGEKGQAAQADASAVRRPAVKRSLVHKLIDRIREL